ncbi:hypothetical protein ZWY2020_053509 [Hordeum vulgare]|nr:hypothetical protein ZWY2020_053509 [Hordeum vulgare]
MATAVSLSLSRALLDTSAPRPSFHRRVSALGTGSALPDARRLCRLSLAVSTAAGAPPLDAGTTAWDALGGVSAFAAGTGDAVPLMDLWDPSEVSSSRVHPN